MHILNYIQAIADGLLVPRYQMENVRKSIL